MVAAGRSSTSFVIQNGIPQLSLFGDRDDRVKPGLCPQKNDPEGQTLGDLLLNVVHRTTDNATGADDDVM